MKFYQAISERVDWFSNYHTKDGELFTEKERNTKVRCITAFWFKVVDIPRNNIVTINDRRFSKI